MLYLLISALRQCLHYTMHNIIGTVNNSRLFSEPSPFTQVYTGKLGVALNSPLSPLCRPNPSACSLGSKSVRLSCFEDHHSSPDSITTPACSSLLTSVSTSTLSLSVYSVMWANHEKNISQMGPGTCRNPSLMSTKSVVVSISHTLSDEVFAALSPKAEISPFENRIPG